MRPIRPVGAVRPVGTPLVRGLVVGGAAYAAGHGEPPLGGVAGVLAELVRRGLLTEEEFALATSGLGD